MVNITDFLLFFISKLNTKVLNIISFCNKNLWDCLAIGREKINNCVNSCIINVLVMGVMMLNQRNISYFKNLLQTETFVWIFQIFGNFTKAPCSKLFFFSVFWFFLFQKKLFPKVYVNFFCSRNNNQNDKLTYRNCFYSQRSVFCITEIKGGNATLNEVYAIKNSLRISHLRKFVYGNLFQTSIPCKSLCTWNVQFSWFLKLKNLENGLIC